MSHFSGAPCCESEQEALGRRPLELPVNTSSFPESSPPALTRNCVAQEAG